MRSGGVSRAVLFGIRLIGSQHARSWRHLYDHSAQFLCLRLIVVLESEQCSVIRIEESEETQGLFYRQLEGDSRLMFEGEAGLFQAYLISPDDGIHRQISFQSALLVCALADLCGYSSGLQDDCQWK